MKKICDGLLYNTDSATVVLPQEFMGEALCITPNGRWFSFRKAELGDSWSITPQTADQAKERLSCHADKYVQFFGEVDPA